MVGISAAALLDGELISVIVRPGGHIAAVLSYGLAIAGVIIGVGELLDDGGTGLLVRNTGSLPGGIVDMSGR